MENCYQGLGEYVKVLLQGSIHHLSRNIIHLIQPHCFPSRVFFGQGRGIFAWGGPMFWDAFLFLLKYFGFDPFL